MTQSRSQVCRQTLGSSRVERVSAGDSRIEGVIRRMIDLARRGLPRMFRPQPHEFAFTRKLQPDGQISLQGSSLRYGAIVVLGTLHLDQADQRAIFAGETASEFAGRLVHDVTPRTNLGDLALVAWAAAEAGDPRADAAFAMLRDRDAAGCRAYTVEAAWVLSALSAGRGRGAADSQIEQARERLLRIASEKSDIFPHWTDLQAAPWLRRHVGCFADQVYPIQALARCAKATGHEEALTVAGRCARQICRLQGSAGQWWWHYDCRTGKVVERYPVYSVHQDAMAPMALLDLAEAGGLDCAESIRLGLGWMIRAAEVDRCLIDDEQAVIWRKVGRTGPTKIVRRIHTLTSRVYPGLQLPWLDGLFRPEVIDHESRPYHLGWVLHAWLGGH